MGKRFFGGASFRASPSSVANARRDALLLGILIGAAILLIWNGSRFFQLMSFAGPEFGPGLKLASTAFTLNIALILFGWRRYFDLQHESELRADSEARAQLMATTDAMTGLLNRKGFADRAEALAIDASQRGDRLVMVSIQMNRIKGVNDRHGFDVGDEMLRRLAAGILAVVEEEAPVARLSGDEFAVALLRHVSKRGAIERVGEALLRAITHPQQVDGKHIQVGAFIGIAMAERGPVMIADLLRRADIALDHAKGARSARPVWFDAGMERALIAHTEIEQGLRFALDHGQIEAWFEPQIDLGTGNLVEFEALARWNHPLSGIIMPDLFIPVAEEIGLIGRLSEEVMRAAFRAAVGWERGIKLSVNISPTQLTDPWLAQRIVRLLAETGFPASRLVVEITESSLFADIDQARAIVTSLKNQGISMALDDFGSGFSSLSHLRSLPFDIIKIDRSFVSTIHRDRESAAIIRAVTTLATAIGLPVTVEGIEDAATHTAVLGIGCTTGQGWYFGKPMTAEKAAELVRGQSRPMSELGRLRSQG